MPGRNGAISRATPSQVGVLSLRERGILRHQMITPYHAKYFAHEFTKHWVSGVPPAGNANSAWVQYFIHHITPLTFPHQTKPLALPLEGLTARAIRRHLTIDERMWFNRMIGEHGEAEVLKLWPSYEVQLNFARSL